MRGWWRPLVLYGGIGIGALVLKGTRDPEGVLLVALVSSPFVVFMALRSILPPSLFLRGLRDQGLGVEIVRDDVSWWGERKLLARTPAGEWRVECHAGTSIHLRVRGPQMRAIREVSGSARGAGRDAAAGLLA